MIYRPISFSPDGSLYSSRSLHQDKPSLASLTPFTATSAETLNASEATIYILRALSGVAADNALKNSLLIRTGGGLVTSSKLSSSSSSNVNPSTYTHTGTEELSNMYSWLDIVGQQLTVVPTPLSSTAESLMLQSSNNNNSFLGNSTMDVLELQHLFSKIGGVRVQSVVKRQNLINEDERENEDSEKTELNDDASYHRLNASKETPCGPLTAYVGSQREAALALCGWSPLLLSSPFEDSMIDPQTGEPFLSIDALASSVPVPLIKTCCLAANSKVGESSEGATTKHTGIE